MDFLTAASAADNTKEWLKESISKTVEGQFKREWGSFFMLLEKEYWNRA
jgi:hypothetical protein